MLGRSSWMPHAPQGVKGLDGDDDDDDSGGGGGGDDDDDDDDDLCVTFLPFLDLVVFLSLIIH